MTVASTEDVAISQSQRGLNSAWVTLALCSFSLKILIRLQKYVYQTALFLILEMRIDLDISITYFLSIQAKQEKSSSIVPSRKHLTANRHVHTAEPVTGIVTFVALKPYTHVHLHVISNLYLIIYDSGMHGL